MRFGLILLLAALLPLLFFIPYSMPSKDFEKAKIIEAKPYIVLQSSSGVLKIKENEILEKSTYDFFAQLVDSSKIQRFEIVPTPEGIGCRVVTNFGRNYASKPEFCAEMALRKDIPIYVYKSLLKAKRGAFLGF